MMGVENAGSARRVKGARNTDGSSFTNKRVLTSPAIGEIGEGTGRLTGHGPLDNPSCVMDRVKSCFEPSGWSVSLQTERGGVSPPALQRDATATFKSPSRKS